jgi:enoyl-CoA hydratase/carnithine racemase
MTEFEDVQYEAKEGIAIVRLNRPEALNAFTQAMGRGLHKAIEAAVLDDAVKVIILTGAGRGFCAGADMKLLQSIQPGAGGAASTRPPAQEDPSPIGGTLSQLGPDLAAHFPGRFGYLLQARKPIIAALNGSAAGLGFVIALYADLRFAASEAKLTTSFAQRGLIAEHGVSWLLPRLVGPANAMDLLLSARKISAAEAKALGLVNDVFPQDVFMAKVMAYARALADTVSPRSMAVIKAQLWKVPFQGFGEALATANAEMQKSFGSEDFKEGVAHYLEKRAPRFTGR